MASTTRDPQLRDENACPLFASIQLLASTSLPVFVAPVGLANLQVVARFPLSVLNPGHIWWKCLSADFPRLAADPSCCDLPQRHDLMHCYGPLRRAILADGERPIIRNSTEAKQLVKLLQGMERASAKHNTNGGRVAGILLGRFELIEWDGNLKLEGPPTVFTLPSKLHEALGASSTAVPVRMALAPNCILLQVGAHQATQTDPHTDQGNMIMDVKAACADGVLHYLQVNVLADGQIQLAHAGVHVFPELENESSEDDRVEVLCALFLRDGERKIWLSHLVDTLHLDE